MTSMMRALFLSTALFAAQALAGTTQMVLIDPSSQRPLPIEVYHPTEPCRLEQPCGVAFLSPGYGIGHRDYRFLAEALNARRFVVLAIDHAAEDDTPFDFQAELRPQMEKKWASGARHFAVIRAQLENKEVTWDWSKLLLVGHSLGGDQSAFYAQRAKVAGVITLDNRRSALPRHVPLLSLRASDTTADPGVLPSASENPNACLIQMKDARHNDMNDAGSAELKARIARHVDGWLANRACPLSSAQ